MCMHRACLCNASARPALWPRNRSMQSANVCATLHGLHTQELSRSPQTVPINTEAADQTCWSAACAYARSAKNARTWWRGSRANLRPSGSPFAESAGGRVVHMQLHRQPPAQPGPQSVISPEKLGRPGTSARGLTMPARHPDAHGLRPHRSQSRKSRGAWQRHRGAKHGGTRIERIEHASRESPCRPCSRRLHDLAAFDAP